MLLIRIGSRNEDILVMDISKHAVRQSDQDELYRLVCAGVSNTAIGLCNAIDQIVPDSCEIDVASDEDDESELNHITIRVVNNSSELQTVLKVGKIQLETTYESYKNYIDYKITEV